MELQQALQHRIRTLLISKMYKGISRPFEGKYGYQRERGCDLGFPTDDGDRRITHLMKETYQQLREDLGDE
jgi:hypothetical protein